MYTTNITLGNCAYGYLSLVQCPACKKDFAIGYIKRHLRDVHGSSASWVATPLMEVCHGMQAYPSVGFPPYCKSVECPVDGCPYRSCNRGTFVTIPCGSIHWIQLLFWRMALFQDVKLATCLSPITRFRMVTTTQSNV
jgi:hypothetical protein